MKDIVIQQGGTDKSLSDISFIETSGKSGNDNWVPEDGCELGEKTITENGTYKASDDGYYGYSKVIVKKAQRAVGKKSNGKTYSISMDEYGVAQTVLLPDYIVIESNPSTTAYQSGATIDKTGLVVKAYCNDGTLWTSEAYPNGIIPNDQIVLSSATAKADQTENSVVYYTSELVDGKVYDCRKITYTDSTGRGVTTNTWDDKSAVFLADYIDAVGDKQYMVPTFGNHTNRYDREARGSDTGYHGGAVFMYQPTGTFTHDGKTVDVCNDAFGENHYNFTFSAPVTTARPSSTFHQLYDGISEYNDTDYARVVAFCWTMQYGESHVEATSGSTATQKITISWERPEDEKPLTSSFNITVEG